MYPEDSDKLKSEFKWSNNFGVPFFRRIACISSSSDLFMTWDWATYFHDYGQENR
ncbi:uncharacterized protein LOC143243129 isoform X4 [Tachypleus tridentatus]|uniref:uncharacterized protein LOC143243129 isoform X4 n=1 Tax=Tachypleus tridentatus TaxID=6853 RepID=UPI003FD40AF2